MRFFAVESEAQQAAAIAYWTRDLLVRQRRQAINAFRAHLAEQGIVVPIGPANVGRLAAMSDGESGVMPAVVRDPARLLLDQIAGLALKRRCMTTDDMARRLTTTPGVGGVTAAAIAPPIKPF